MCLGRKITAGVIALLTVFLSIIIACNTPTKPKQDVLWADYGCDRKNVCVIHIEVTSEETYRHAEVYFKIKNTKTKKEEWVSQGKYYLDEDHSRNIEYNGVPYQKVVEVKLYDDRLGKPDVEMVLGRIEQRNLYWGMIVLTGYVLFVGFYLTTTFVISFMVDKGYEMYFEKRKKVGRF